MQENPKYRDRPLYIVGESYAGHYIPPIAKYLYENHFPYVNLSGLAIGNGWVDPFYQYPASALFALENNLISMGRYVMIEYAFNYLCEFSMLMEVPFFSLAFCDFAEFAIVGIPIWPNFNLYDFRKPCENWITCYPDNGLTALLNNDAIRDKIGVSRDTEWQECNFWVHLALMLDYQVNYGHYLKDLLNDGLPVLVYSGDKDFICNWRGGLAWTEGLIWDKHPQFVSSEFTKWAGHESQVAGEFKEADNFTFLKIYDAGHMVPMDKPENAYAMLMQFLRDGKLKAATD